MLKALGMFNFDVVWKDCSPFLGGNLLVDGVLSLKMVSGGLNHDSKLPFFTKSLFFSVDRSPQGEPRK